MDSFFLIFLFSFLEIYLNVRKLCVLVALSPFSNEIKLLKMVGVGAGVIYNLFM